jgi:Catalase
MPVLANDDTSAGGNFLLQRLGLDQSMATYEYLLRAVGKIVLDENPQNYFAKIEQAAFSPSHTVPGIEPIADPVLQSRLFSYQHSSPPSRCQSSAVPSQCSYGTRRELPT